MTFTKRLRDGVRRGGITCSVRFWLGPRVTVGKRYPMEDGKIEVDSIEQIGFPDITPELARAGISGCAGSAEGCQARQGRKDLSREVSLHSAEEDRGEVISGGRSALKDRGTRKVPMISH